MRPDELDLVIVATDTPDYLSPATSSVVQAKLGALNAGTFDVNCACAGWVTALDMASQDHRGRRQLPAHPGGGRVRHDAGYVNWKDKKTCTLFADGAGAVVLGAGDKPGFMAAQLLANGEYHDALGIYTGGTARPATRRDARS